MIKGSGASSSTTSFKVVDSSNTTLFYVRDDGVVLVGHNYLFVNNSSGFYSDGKIRARAGITDDQGPLLLGNNDAVDAMTISSSKVGIGTTTPSSLFVVRAADGVMVDTATALIQNAESTAGDNFGLYVQAGTNTSDISFRVADKDNNEYMRVRGDGNVAIGTTNAAEKLIVAGNISASGNLLLDGNITASNSQFGSGGKIEITHSGGAGVIDNKTANLIIKTSANERISLSPAGAESLTVANGGNVGIGTNDPQKKLDIAGGDIRLDNSQGIFFATTDGNINRVGITGDESSDFIQLKVDNSNNHLLRLNTTGVGIGTSTPSSKLTVVGDISASSDLILEGGITASTNIHVGQYIYHDGDLTNYHRFISNRQIFVVGNDSSIDLNNGVSTFGVASKATTVQGDELNLTGPVTASGDISASGKLRSTGLEFGHFNNFLNFTAGGTANTFKYNEWKQSASGGTTINNTAGTINFDSKGNADTMVISGSKVGIGTTTPSQGLHVVDAGIITSEFESSDNSSALIEVSNNAGLDAFFGVYSGNLVLRHDDYTANHFSMDTSGNITASGNISASGVISSSQLSVDGNVLLGTANIFTPAGTVDFFALGSSARATRARSGQFSTAYSGTIPDNGILFGTDTTLQRTAATVLTLNGTLISSTLKTGILADTTDDTTNFTLTSTGIEALIADDTILDLDANTVTAHKSLFARSHITASGNISASGDLFANELTLKGASAGISIEADSGTEIISTGTSAFNITSGGDLYLLAGSNEEIRFGSNNTNDELRLNKGHITASGNISASGKVITSELSAPGDLTIDADGADILLKDGGTEFGRFKRDSSNFVIKSATNDKDIVFRGVDNSATITALTLDMSDAGSATFNNHITASGNISASGIVLSDSIVHGTDTDTNVAFSDNQIRITAGSHASVTHTSTGASMPKRKFAITGNTDGTADGDIVYIAETESMTPGAIYYLKSNNTWELANATTVGKSNGLLGVALGNASLTDGVLLRGMVTIANDPGSVGDVLFLSETADGQATATAPSTAGNVVRVIGYCLDDNNGQVWFNPDGAFVEVS